MKATIIVAGALLALTGCTSTGGKATFASTTSAKASASASATTTATAPSSSSVAPAPTSSAAASSAPPSNQGKPGQTAHLGFDDGTKVDVTVESVADKTTGIGSLAQAPQFGHFAVADVLIVNVTGSYDYNPLDFGFQEPDATTYNADGGNAIFAGFEPALHSGTLTTGQKIRGLITFDVKDVAGGFVQVGDGSKVLAQWSTH